MARDDLPTLSATSTIGQPILAAATKKKRKRIELANEQRRRKKKRRPPTANGDPHDTGHSDAA
jgi:hypothetical protein